MRGWLLDSTITAKMITRSDAQVVPIFFEGHNSRLFQVASHIHYNLRNVFRFRCSLLSIHIRRTRYYLYSQHSSRNYRDLDYTHRDPDNRLFHCHRSDRLHIGRRKILKSYKILINARPQKNE